MLRSIVLVSFALGLNAQLHTLTKEQMIEITSKNPFERFADGRPKAPDALLEKARGLSVEEAWGPLNKEYPNHFEGNWRVMHPGKKMVGRAVTAQFMPVRVDLNEIILARLKNLGHRGAAHQWVIDQLQPGDVFVVDLFGKVEGGTIVGDNLAAAIQSATANGGLVVDGSIRDLEGIYPLGMPIYHRGVHPSAIGGVMLTGYNIPVRIGSATVVPGDVVFGDRTGVAFIPPARIQTIVDRAEETHIHDEWTKQKFGSGRYKSSDLYPTPRDPELRKEYEEYKKKRLGKP
jgi:4-hydroxy-4-methyl-2-oxoglutarate aldolase